jgi:tetratricopeptide (TPR) repeat protein
MFLFTGAYFLSFMPFFVTAIYRVPIIWVLLLLSSFGIWSFYRLLTEKRFREAAIGTLVLLGMIGLTRIPFVDYEPKIARVYYDRGVAFVYAGDDPAAIEQFEKTTRAEPGHLEANFNLAGALVRQGHIDAGIAHYTKALATKPTFAPAHNNMGAIYMDRGLLKKAIEHFQQALIEEPLNVNALTNLGLCLAREGELGRAVTYFEQAMEQPGADRQALGNDMGVALYLMGRLEDAIRILESTLSLNPQSSETINHLGEALLRAGRRTEAIGYFQKALQINPDDSTARANLSRALPPTQ